ncbi:MAG: hypothetical protein IIB40_07710 [Candidatus Marinimicrobia bacterium]|nr:hypothetical protein [Candidatus Neomarinimicrobiota bacterium]
MAEDVTKEEHEALKAMFKKRSEQERIRNYATSNITILDAAIKVMRIGNPSDPYHIVSSNMIILPKPTEAVTDLLKKNQRQWSFSEIVDEINKTGVNSSAGNISSSISSVLRSLEKTGDITITGVKRKRKYKWSADN